MKKRLAKLIATGLLILVPTICQAEPVRAYMSGNDLFDTCSVASDRTFLQGTCDGYIVGAIDAMQDSKTTCVPAGVVIKQLRDVVVQYLQAHPEERQYTAAGIIREAISEAFPCR